jgi:hypothetical protein
MVRDNAAKIIKSSMAKVIRLLAVLNLILEQFQSNNLMVITEADINNMIAKELTPNPTWKAKADAHRITFPGASPGGGPDQERHRPPDQERHRHPDPEAQPVPDPELVVRLEAYLRVDCHPAHPVPDPMRLPVARGREGLHRLGPDRPARDR